MRILMFNWRDHKNPASGGAEFLTNIMLKGLAEKGYEVTLFTSTYAGGTTQEKHNGYTIIRRGSIYTAGLHAWRYYQKNIKNQTSTIIIDQIHGLPFFTPLYIKNQPIIAFIHEVAGQEIWRATYSFPIAPLGAWLEKKALQLYRQKKFITVSNSTKQELITNEIPEKHITIIPETNPVPLLSSLPSKKKNYDLLLIGRLVPVKRVEDAIKATLILKKKYPDIHLSIIGSGQGTYAEKIKKMAARYPTHITLLGKVNEAKKIATLTTNYLLICTSIKEGFGLSTIEAAANGTPTVAYNVAGLRDSIKDGHTGLLSHQTTPQELAKSIEYMLENNSFYEQLRYNAWHYSQQFTASQTIKVFENALAPTQTTTA